MPSSNRIILASAGSGKTTTIIDDACGSPDNRSALITYTINNTAEIRSKTYSRIGFVPPNLTISTWYAFLLRHFVRPYQKSLYSQRVSRIIFVNEMSARGTRASDIGRHYFGKPGRIYSDKVSKFACEIIRETGGLPLRRLEQIFDRLYVDEGQDLAGYDLDLLELMMQSGISITVVGDHRQATFSTNPSNKNKRFARAGIIDKFEQWHKSGLCKLEYQYHSHRCTQAICDFADQFFPSLQKTTSLNPVKTGHDGVFAVPCNLVSAYMQIYAPQVLRYSRAQKDIPGNPINFGAAKGMTFERTIIFPHKALGQFLSTGILEDAGRDIPKIYVGITRAKQSVAFVVPDGAYSPLLPIFKVA